MIFLVSLERVDIEYCVFPGNARGLQRILNCVSLGIIWGDDLELSSLPEVSLGHMDSTIDFGCVLGGRWIFSINNVPCSRRPRTVQL